MNLENYEEDLKFQKKLNKGCPDRNTNAWGFAERKWRNKSNENKKFSTLQEAKTACSSDAQCGGVYDPYCAQSYGPYELCDVASKITGNVLGCVYDYTKWSVVYLSWNILSYNFVWK